MPPSTRRQFLRQGTLASTLLWTGCQSRDSVSPTPAAAKLGNGQKVRLAVVGIGNRGTQVMRAFADTDLIEFVTGADVDLEGEHCAEARELFGNRPLYLDFRTMLAEQGDNFDAVAICTPDFAHFPVAMACMAAGKHVYLEKPLAHTFEEVDLLVEQATPHWRCHLNGQSRSFRGQLLSIQSVVGSGSHQGRHTHRCTHEFSPSLAWLDGPTASIAGTLNQTR
ncbi:MAG: Gfo/Idh/MocA family oxidoreductase [Candidatus Synoicihabitans palmerolidicus]|nr:Gfo/Idh/MocA family oxidoreductase [Candidatus Synoicihabitans palmerolidicus]